MKHGVNDFLTKDEKEWYKLLKILIEDGKLRKSLGQKGERNCRKRIIDRG